MTFQKTGMEIALTFYGIVECCFAFAVLLADVVRSGLKLKRSVLIERR